MNTILRWAFAACVLLGAAEGLSAQAIIRSAATALSGTAAPASGDCDAAAELGRLYVQAGDPASVVNQVWACMQTGAATFAWRPASIQTGTAAPATCTTGQVFFDTDATAGSNWFGCTAADTWTALGGGGVSTVSARIPLSSCGFLLGGALQSFAPTGTGGASGYAYQYYLMTEAGTTPAISCPLVFPAGATSVDVVFGFAPEGTGAANVRMQLHSACFEAASTSWTSTPSTVNTATAATIAQSATYRGVSDTTISGAAVTGCPGQFGTINLTRLPADAADTSTFDIYLMGVTLVWHF